MKAKHIRSNDFALAIWQPCLGVAAADVDRVEPDLVAVVDHVGAGQQHRQHYDQLTVLHGNPLVDCRFCWNRARLLNINRRLSHQVRNVKPKI